MADTTSKPAARKTAAKKPQDHLPKAEARGDVLTAEFRGVSVSVPADALDDYDAISQLSKGLPDAALAVMVPNGADRQALIDSCRDEEGRARLSDVVTMTSELMGALGAGN